MFANIDESVQSEVKLGDDKKVAVMGKGSIKFETKKGEKKHIPNLYYVPNIKHNLNKRDIKFILKMMHVRFLIHIEH